MARKIILLLTFLALAAGYAHAIGIGGEGRQFGRVGATAGKATAAPPPPTCASPNAPDGVVDLSKCSNAWYVAVIF